MVPSTEIRRKVRGGQRKSGNEMERLLAKVFLFSLWVRNEASLDQCATVRNGRDMSQEWEWTERVV